MPVGTPGSTDGRHWTQRAPAQRAQSSCIGTIGTSRACARPLLSALNTIKR